MRQRVAARARARAGRRRAADGRALRRARRDDARRAARRARAHLVARPASRCCSSPTTCARRSASAIASCCSRAGRAASWPSSPIDIPRPRRIDSPDVAELAAAVTDRLRRGGAPPWPLSRPAVDRARSLDAGARRASTRSTCRSQPPQSPRAPIWARPGRSSPPWHRGRRSGSSSCGAAGGPSTCCPARRAVFAELGDAAQTAEFWARVAITLRRALPASRSRSSIGTALGLVVLAKSRPALAPSARSSPACRRCRRSPGSRSRSCSSSSPKGRSCSWSCSAPRRRSRTA